MKAKIEFNEIKKEIQTPKPGELWYSDVFDCYYLVAKLTEDQIRKIRGKDVGDWDWSFIRITASKSSRRDCKEDAPVITLGFDKNSIQSYNFVKVADNFEFSRVE